MVDPLPDEKGQFSGPKPILFGMVVFPPCNVSKLS